MDNSFGETLWKNFAATIDMLAAVVTICPDEIWKNDKQFYYMGYHSVIFLDYYLSNPVSNFRPALPYTLADPDHLPAGAIDDVLPNELYSKEAMLDYLANIRGKCKRLICFSPAAKFASKWIEENEIDMHGLCPPFATDYTVLEILFYNLRHVQHHTAQLNLLLRQKVNIAAGWISQAE